MTEQPAKLDWNKGGGLLPAIVQHADDGRVLMLGYMNPVALAHTRKTGRVTFFSRSRQRLWTKGETSGHVLQCVSITADCDHDTLLVQARPHGPVCHLGSATCFGDWPATSDAFLYQLDDVIRDRARAGGESSYTARLLARGVAHCAQKVGEEAVETALAAVSGDRDHLAAEAADLIYHLLVCLHAGGSSLDAVLATLRARHAQRAISTPAAAD